ncbi:MAG: transglutaminase domain-containing protein, partial [Acidimicrobiales bacterium]
MIVSSLVRVGEEEVDNTNAVLFTVHSSQLTREVLDVLDNFNGDVWSAAPLRHRPAQLPELTGSLSRLAATPPGITFVRGAGVLTQVLTIGDLGGDELPAAGPAIAAGGISPVEALSASGPLIDVQGLRRDESYSIESYVSPPPPSAGPPSLSSFASPATGVPADRLQLVISRNAHKKVLVPRRAPGDRATVAVASAVSGTNGPGYSDLAVDVDPSVDLRLPSPVPSALVDLSHQIVAKATAPAEEAALIQQYLADNPSFHYHLPRRLKGGGISDPGEGYGPLLRFLFRTHTGYCQQYASAFAVLARI